MKRIIKCLILSLFLVNSAFAAPICADLFKSLEEIVPNVPVRELWKADRSQVSEMSNPGATSRLKISEKAIDFNSEEGSIELLKMMVHTTSFTLNDKNVLYKNQLSLGMPIGEGYSINLKYESDGRTETKFYISDIELVTPTGYSSKVSKSILEKTKFKIAKTEVELPAELYPTGRSLWIDVPLTIEGKVLKQLDKMTSSLELFTKDELREIVNQKTMAQIKRKFLVRKTVALFKKYFIAAPFKTIANLAPTLILASAIGYGVAAFPTHVEVVKSVETHEWINTSINEAAAKTLSPEVKIEFNELKAEILDKVKRDKKSTTPILGAASTAAAKYQFSENHMTWVFEQRTNTGSLKTYIVFTEELAGVKSEPMKYLITEIDPVKYAELIKVIKAQGKVLTH